MHAELARFVRRRADHAPLARPSDDDRLPAQLRPVALLDRGVEGVHVDMKDLSHGISSRLRVFAWQHLRVTTMNIPTPAFLVDRTIVEQNCLRMRAKAQASGVLFRPHVKTHKTIEIG